MYPWPLRLLYLSTTTPRRRLTPFLTELPPDFDVLLHDPAQSGERETWCGYTLPRLLMIRGELMSTAAARLLNS